MSTSPSSSATSSSFVQSAFPPSRYNACDWFLSPPVVMKAVSKVMSGCAARRASRTEFVWICASSDVREARVNLRGELVVAEADIARRTGVSDRTQ